ncbi:MAG: Chemoreceptor glutamine deamidase CheD [Candidatus Heimdallarchaeota archaeon LC_2]|nr:MAG: Chemoreceptor glutamine deamidase CheD [Candidatus Heimdallarchaeota archaeon LC_2]
MAVHTARIGDIVFGRAPDSLEALALGSCVAAFIYDKEAKIGVCAHILLPESNEYMIQKDSNHKLGKYADSAIPASISLLVTKGGKRERFEAKIAGGAKMFNLELQKKSPLDVGSRNILAVKAQLQSNNIALVAEDVGENYGRTVVFDLGKSILTIKQGLLKIVRYI